MEELISPITNQTINTTQLTFSPSSLWQLIARPLVLPYGQLRVQAEPLDEQSSDPLVMAIRSLVKCLDPLPHGHWNDIPLDYPPDKSANPVRYVKLQNEYRWVVKWNGKNLIRERPSEARPEREHVAFVLSAGSLFPIKPTFRIEFRGQPTIAVEYVQKCVPVIRRPNSPQPSVSIDSLQKTIVFDLLFSNGDRTDGNVLGVQEALTQQLNLWAIDHGEILPEEGDGPIVICGLLYLKETQLPLSPELARILFSAESIQHYEKVLNTHGKLLGNREWLQLAIDCLSFSVSRHTPLSLAATGLIYIKNHIFDRNSDVNQLFNTFGTAFNPQATTTDAAVGNLRKKLTKFRSDILKLRGITL